LKIIHTQNTLPLEEIRRRYLYEMNIKNKMEEKINTDKTNKLEKEEIYKKKRPKLMRK